MLRWAVERDDELFGEVLIDQRVACVQRFREGETESG